MNDWLDVMLGEVDRKKQENEESLEEAKRRAGDNDAAEEAPADSQDSSK